MKKNLLLVILVILVVSPNVWGQGTDCSTAEPFCTDSGASFPAGVDNGDFQPFGNSYNCGFDILTSQPNAAWYYLEISVGGNLIIDLTSAPAEDIDFALWGPFPNLSTAQFQCGSLSNPIDCSFDPAATEVANITGATVGEVYLLMITNFSNFPTNISASLAGGSTGATSCDIVNPPSCNVTPISCNSTAFGVTEATPPPPSPDCFGGGSAPDGNWYSFVGNGQPITLFTDGFTIDTRIQVFTSDNSGGDICSSNLTCVTQNDDANFFTLGSLVDFVTNVGITYYIYVDAYDGASGSYELVSECCDANIVASANMVDYCFGTTPGEIGTDANWILNSFDAGPSDTGTGDVWFAVICGGTWDSVAFPDPTNAPNYIGLAYPNFVFPTGEADGSSLGCDYFTFIPITSLSYNPATQIVTLDPDCFATGDPFEILFRPEIIEIGNNTYDCNTNSITLTFDGGSNDDETDQSHNTTGNFMISGDLIGTTIGNSITFNDLMPNTTYTYTVTDPSGCSQTFSFTVPICCVMPDIFNSGPQTACNSYTLPTISGTDLTGGQDYYNDSQANGGTTLTGPITTTTTVWIYDGVTGCEDEESFLVTINSDETVTITETHCSSENFSITIGGDTYNEANPTGTTTEVGAATNGCDLITTVNLTFTSDETAMVTETHCSSENYSITIGGDTYNEANPTGTTMEAGAAANGCNLITTVNLTFTSDETAMITETHCSSENYSITIGGDTYNEANPTGTTTEVGAATNGCDLITTVNLTFTSDETAMVTGTHCSSENYFITIGGDTYNEANPTGMTTEVGVAANGCDVVTTVNLTFTSDETAMVTETHCSSENFSITIGGDTYNEANPTGTTTEVGVAANGCDVVTTVNLTFTSDETAMVTETHCSSENFSITIGGDTYNEANPTGTTTEVGAASNGCDLISTVNLTFTSDETAMITENHCSSENYFITIGGDTYNEGNPTGTTTEVGGAANGCDLITIVNLTFTSDETAMITETHCSSENYSITIGGDTYNEANPTGMTTEVGAAANGCNLVTTVNLTFTSDETVTITETHCSTANYSITIGGDTYNESNPTGITTEVAAAANGCDVVTTVNLTFTSDETVTITETHCSTANYSITIGGDTYNEANPTGTTTEVGAATNGCDLITTVNLTFTSDETAMITETHCSSENYSITIGGDTYNEANPTGTTTEVGAATNGCNLITTVNLTFTSDETAMITETHCSSENYSITIGGDTYNEANPTGTTTEVGAATNGCNLITTVNLTFTSDETAMITETHCSSENYSITIGGDTYNEANPTGITTEVGAAVNGCNVVTTVNLTFTADETATVIETHCSTANYSITIGGDTYNEVNPTGTTTEAGAATNGCDLITTVNLTFTSDETATITETHCSSENYSITIGADTYNEANPTGTTTEAGAATNGCDLITTVNLTFTADDNPSFTLTDFCAEDANSATITGTTGGTFAFNPNSGDGAIINSVTGEITNEVGGTTYSIEYTTVGSCPMTSIQTVLVNSLDDASFIVSDFCEGATNSATITGTAGGVFVFNPVLGDGAILNGTTGAITNGVAGTTYTLQYTTAGICSDMKTQTVTVLFEEDASFTLTDFCEGTANSATITGNSGGSFAFNPTVSDGATINPVTGTITNGVGGTTYTVEYTTNGTCPSFSTQTVTVIASDIAVVSIPDFCAGTDSQSAVVVGTTGGTFSFNPFPVDGATINMATGVISGGTGGTTYFIDYTTPINGCQAIIPFQTTAQSNVNSGTADFVSSFCEGESMFLDLTVLLSGEDAGGTWTSDTDGSISIFNSSQIDLSTLTNGTYEFTYTVTSNAPCVNASTTLSIIINAAPSIANSLVTDVLCNNDNTGAIDLLVTGSNLDYDWTGTGVIDGQEDQTGLAIGNYSVIITDINTNCFITEDFTIDQPMDLAIDCTNPTNETAPGLNNGTVTLVFSGGSPTYSISYIGAASPVVNLGTNSSPLVVSNLAPDDYTVTITDINGCQETCTFTINSVGCDLSLNEATTDILCAADLTGEIDIIVGGVPNGVVSYNWVGAGTINGQEDQTGLAAGNYFLTISDESNCTATMSIEITEPTALGINNLVIENTNCGLNNGSIEVIAGGGTGLIEYSLDGELFTTNNIFEDLASGNHDLIVEDENGCQTIQTVNVPDDGTPVITTVNTINANCGLPTGEIEVIASGGLAPLSYEIDANGFGVNNTFTGLTSGFHTVIVEDANGCQVNQMVEILDEGAPSIDMIELVNSTCGAATGSITITASGGTAPLMYSLTGIGELQTNNVFNGLTAGNYTVLVQDANACQATELVNIQDDGSPTIDEVNVVDASCSLANGSLTIVATGGVAPLMYSITGVAGLQANNIFIDLAASNYDVLVEDATGCQTTLVAVVQGSSAPIITEIIIEDASCGIENGTCEIIITGGTADFMYSINGGTPQASNIFTDLGEGDIDILVTDANNCSVTGMATINNNLAATIDDVVLTHTTCGNDDGIIEITASGTGTPFLYNIGTGYFPTNIFTNLSAGNYTVEVLDANGCMTIENVTINDSNVPSIDDVIIIPSACGLSIGSIEIIASNGIAPLMYSITGGAPYAVINTFDNLSASNYDISIIDANGCTSETTVVLGEIAPIVLACGQNAPATTVGGTEGIGQVNIMGGTAPYSVDWNGGNLSNQVEGDVLISNLAAGNYNVIVTDANGCEALCDFTINGPGCNLTISDISTDVTCNGANNGTIEVTIEGGTDPIDYVWDNGGTTAILTDLPPGTYNLSATDGTGCPIVTSIVISEPDLLVLTCNEDTPATLGNNDGIGVVNISGGTSDYTVEWTGGGILTNQSAGAVQITDLTAGTYTVTVTDANGCIETCNFTINEPGCPLSISEIHTNVSCFGGNNGSLTATILGGVDPINYAWDNGGTAASLTDLTAGTYVLDATDANNCTIGISVMIEEPEPIIIVCNENTAAGTSNDDGIGQAIITGGTAPYTADWGLGMEINIPEATMFFCPDLPAGNYTVVITDANGCISECNFIINGTNCNLSIIDIVTTDVNCNGESTGAISVNASGANGIVDYNWNGGMFNGTDLIDLPAGDYVLQAIDEEGCSAMTTITIDEPTPIVLSCDEQTSASDGNNNGVGVVNISGGTADYLVEWSGGMLTGQTAGDVLMTDLLAGNYTVTVTDANGCIETCDFIITGINCVISTSNIVEGTCNNQGTLADATDDTFTVTLDVSAQNGGTQVLVTNNLNAGQWGPFPYGNITIDNLPANGVDIILIFEDTSIGGCMNTITVAQMPCSDCSLTADAGNDQVISCASSNVSLSGSSNEVGADYLWTGPLGFVDVMTQNTTADISGWYYLNVTNTGTGCTAIDSVFVDVSADIPSANAVVSNELNCDLLEATITASSNVAGVTFIWTGPNNEPYVGDIITVTQAGIYTLVVTNPANNCTSPPTGFEVIGNYNQPIAIIQNVTDELNCATIATGITLDGTGSSIGDTMAYIWTLDDDIIGNNITQQIFVEGEYIFTVINLLNNCTEITSVNIEESIVYPIADAGLDAEITCTEPTVTLDGSNSDDFDNVVYSWTGPVGATIENNMTRTPTVDMAGDYIITVVDTSNMCTNIDQVEVIDNTTLPTAVINGGFTLNCVTISGILDATGSSQGNDFVYQWLNSTGELTGQTNLQLDVNTPDTYTFQVTNTENGCVNEASEEVNEDVAGLPIPTFIDNPPTCFGDSDGSLVLDTIVGGEPPYLFSFEGQDFTNSSIFNNLSAGDYSIIVEDAIGCQEELMFTVKNGNDLVLDLGENQLITFGDSTEIEALVNIGWPLVDTLIWEEEESLSCLDCIETTATPFTTTTYSAQVIDENGCIAVDFVTIVVNRDLNIYVPTAFSPDNDGNNDVLTIYAGDQVVKVNTFLIYDRWGEKVYQYYNFPPNDDRYGWDGFKNLQLMNPQVFVYHIEVELVDGTTESVSGDFTLIR